MRAVNRKTIVASVLAKAKRYRNLTRMIDDRETARRILDLTEELKRTALALARADEDASVFAPAKSGTKMAGRPGGIRSSGMRPNGSFAKQKISQSMLTKRSECRSGRPNERID